MNNNTECQGGCSCGEVRYRVIANPLIVHACYCRQCQRVTGSAFVLNALIKKDELALLSGNVSRVRFPGTYHTAYFCKTCATYVWSEYKSGRFDECWFLRVGTLDEPDRTPPNVHIFVESKQPWVVLPDDVPIYRQFYKIEDVWQKSSIARMGRDWSPSARRPDIVESVRKSTGNSNV